MPDSSIYGTPISQPSMTWPLPKINSNGWLVLEHGHKQKESVKKLLYAAQFKSIVHHYDLSGHPRVTVAQTTNF